MEWYNKLKSFLGFPESPNFNNDAEKYWAAPPEPDGLPSRHFNIFTEPLEMHRYFEEQMSEMLRNFGFPGFNDGFHGFHDGFQFESPQIEESHPDDLRDQYLKPGYENPRKDELKDQDLDGKLDIKDWDSVFKRENPVQPRPHFFGQSMTSQTIRKSDGSVEIHRTVRDNHGNEETTITRKVDDKEYTIIKKRDKNGKEETVENMINLDENELKGFMPDNKLPQLPNQPWPFYDNFFK